MFISVNQNEKRRDKEWTERINKILERRDELLRTADIRESACRSILSRVLSIYPSARVEAKVDKIVRPHLILRAVLLSLHDFFDPQFADMEAKRDLTQSIVHVDMDAFYANVEMLYNPELAGKPFAVVRHPIASCHSMLTLMNYFSLISSPIKPGRTRNCYHRIV